MLCQVVWWRRWLSSRITSSALPSSRNLRLKSGQDLDRERGGTISRAVNAMDRFAVVFGFRRRDIDEGLWVAIHEREPGALHLDHHAMAAAEGVTDVRQGELNLRHFLRFKWFWFLEAVTEFAAE